ncbi:MAG: hypothetical protein KKE20_05590 [Nanoarchaeota archaeon]|nr:hypothetical protein [Nanoarchaeota archaeon]
MASKSQASKTAKKNSRKSASSSSNSQHDYADSVITVLGSGKKEAKILVITGTFAKSMYEDPKTGQKSRNYPIILKDSKKPGDAEH